MQNYSFQRHSTAVELNKILKLLAEQTASEEAAEQGITQEPALRIRASPLARNRRRFCFNGKIRFPLLWRAKECSQPLASCTGRRGAESFGFSTNSRSAAHYACHN